MLDIYIGFVVVLNIATLIALIHKLEDNNLNELVKEEIKDITWLEMILEIIFLLPFILLVGVLYMINKTKIWSKLNSKVFKED